MDYKALLIKYMAHVISSESIDYISYINDGFHSGVEFTEDEIKELENISSAIAGNR